jgi:hypothetical protein
MESYSSARPVSYKLWIHPSMPCLYLVLMGPQKARLTYYGLLHQQETQQLDMSFFFLIDNERALYAQSGGGHPYPCRLSND